MSDDALEQRVADALALDERFAARGPFTVYLQRRVPGHITMVHAIELRFGHRCERYWVKRYSRRGDAFKEWSFLGQRVSRGGFTLADAAAYLPPPLDALVTVHAHGEKLADRFTGEDRRQAIDRDCAGVARWLAALHEPAGAQSLGTHPTDAIARDIETRLRAVAGIRQIPLELTRAVLDETTRVLAATPADDLARVRTHGDFAPFNILVDSEHATGTVLDPSFEASIDRLDNWCARHEDAARFLTCIEFMESLTDDERREASDRFLSGYASEGVDLRTPVLTLFRLKYRLQGLIDQWGAPLADARRRGVPRMLEDWLRH